MYADDTTFHVYGSNVEEISAKLNIVSKNISNWCNDNKMAINYEKQNVGQPMLICTRHNENNLPDIMY